MAERSAGKDTTTGHWEMMGVVLDHPFPTYPDGFPPEVIDAFADAIGRGVLGNKPASGTEIIKELGSEHLATGRPIVYTSADSVFQIATHKRVVPLEQLYAWCEQARALLTGEHAVGRVIARPFDGEEGAFFRTKERRDYALPPAGPTVLEALERAGVRTLGVGKIEDIFSRRGLTGSDHTGDNETSIDATVRFLGGADGPTFVFTNLVDFDMVYGHRRDAEGTPARSSASTPASPRSRPPSATTTGCSSPPTTAATPPPPAPTTPASSPPWSPTALAAPPAGGSPTAPPSPTSAPPSRPCSASRPWAPAPRSPATSADQAGARRPATPREVDQVPGPLRVSVPPTSRSPVRRQAREARTGPGHGNQATALLRVCPQLAE